MRHGRLANLLVTPHSCSFSSCIQYFHCNVDLLFFCTNGSSKLRSFVPNYSLASSSLFLSFLALTTVPSPGFDFLSQLIGLHTFCLYCIALQGQLFLYLSAKHCLEEFEDKNANFLLIAILVNIKHLFLTVRSTASRMLNA